MVVMVGGVGRQFDRPSFLSGIEAYYPSQRFFDRVIDSDDGVSELALALGLGLWLGLGLGLGPWA